MLDTANDWLGDADEEPITAEQFADRITLSELAFRNDGSIEAYYDDGDIFWGHCIIVRMDKNGNIEDAEIAGWPEREAWRKGDKDMICGRYADRHDWPRFDMRE